ncbi:reverse transcriptase domain, reverse transcriptase zinc-binding domain protein [Tanacetum coccineum]
MDESRDDASDDDFVSDKKTTTIPTEKKKAQPFLHLRLHHHQRKRKSSELSRFRRSDCDGVLEDRIRSSLSTLCRGMAVYISTSPIHRERRSRLLLKWKVASRSKPYDISSYPQDDLIVFARGDFNSAKVIMESLQEFKEVSGLVPSISKSTAFFCNVASHVKSSILQTMSFEAGILPIKYLGVPLISYRLLYKDCKILVERVQNRISDWKNKSLSSTGRLQLVFLVVSSMHGYWASVFILPTRIIQDIQQLMRDFLWCHGDMKKGKAKVACTWNTTFPVVNQIIPPLLIENKEDQVMWKTRDGRLEDFQVWLVWDTIRPRAHAVPWTHIVWFTAAIPRHAFHVWLLMCRKLKTQDKLRQWDVGESVDLNLLRCPLCKAVPDSHEHLFFKCSFSSKV